MSIRILREFDECRPESRNGLGTACGASLQNGAASVACVGTGQFVAVFRSKVDDNALNICEIVVLGSPSKETVQKLEIPRVERSSAMPKVRTNSTTTVSYTHLTLPTILLV